MEAWRGGGLGTALGFLGQEGGEWKLLHLFFAFKPISGDRPHRSTAALNFGSFCSRNHKGKENWILLHKNVTLECGKIDKQISFTINQFERQMIIWKDAVAAYLTNKGLDNLNMQKVYVNQ